MAQERQLEIVHPGSHQCHCQCHSEEVFVEECKALSPLGPAQAFPLYYLFLLAQGRKENILSHKPCEIGKPCAKLCLEMHAQMTFIGTCRTLDTNRSGI